MIEYLELHDKNNNNVIVKLSSISIFEDLNNGSLINKDTLVKENVEQIKAMLNDDPKRFVWDGEIDFRVRILKRLTVAEIAKKFPGQKAVDFIHALMTVNDEKEADALWEQYSLMVAEKDKCLVQVQLWGHSEKIEKIRKELEALFGKTYKVDIQTTGELPKLTQLIWKRDTNSEAKTIEKSLTEICKTFKETFSVCTIDWIPEEEETFVRLRFCGDAETVRSIKLELEKSLGEIYNYQLNDGRFCNTPTVLIWKCKNHQEVKKLRENIDKKFEDIKITYTVDLVNSLQ